jgi:type IV pilus assembly protein PilA
MLARLRKTQEEREGGFTLIELLVVVIIIGILAAIAIPTFLNQREKAWQKAAQSDLRNHATVVEEYFSENGSFPATQAAITVKPSDGVTVTLFGDADSYCINANHNKLTAQGVDYVLKSSTGKPQATFGTGAVAACTDANS